MILLRVEWNNPLTTVDILLTHTPREGPNAMGYKGIWDKRNLAPNKRSLIRPSASAKWALSV